MFAFHLRIEAFHQQHPENHYNQQRQNLQQFLGPFQSDCSDDSSDYFESSSEDESDVSSIYSEDSIEFVNSKPSGIISESIVFLHKSQKERDISNKTDYRLGKITVEMFPDAKDAVEDNDDILPVVSGYTELSYGILHLYRQTQPSPQEVAKLKVVCVLAVPSYLTPAEFLQFVRPVRKKVTHFRLLRDTRLNRYLVLIKFRQASAAMMFYQRFNGMQFTSMEPERCHVVFVKSIQIQSSALPSYVFPVDSAHPADYSSKKPAQEDLVELPTCPVCLERMDASVSGILTTLCHHTFHCQCLSAWTDSRCPVCRFSQSNSKALEGEQEDGNRSKCFECDTTENLWICLICGHIGCGRYQQGHARNHFSSTQHLYSMEVETQRVWDYAGDGYVHRLIQSKEDGKLVELPPHDLSGDVFQAAALSHEKMDALGLEFSYVLTSSLESQRIYYEHLLESATRDLTYFQSKADQCEHNLSEMTRGYSELQLHFDQTSRDKEALEAKMAALKEELKKATETNEKLRAELKSLQGKLKEEEAISDSLRLNQKGYRDKMDEYDQKIKAKEAEISDLQEQVRDLMAFVEMRDKVEKELAQESSESARRSIIEGSIGAKPTAKRKGKRRERGNGGI